MTQTLQQLTSDRRARLLARIAERYLPNPGIDPPSEISPDDDAVQERILEEIKVHLGITAEETPEDKKAIIDYLSEGMSRAILENADLKAIEYRLGQRGELQTKEAEHKVEVSESRSLSSNAETTPGNPQEDTSAYHEHLSKKVHYRLNGGIEWLRQYKNHQETVIYNRVNFFSLMLSIFMAGVLSLDDTTDAALQRNLSGLGFFLTLVWWLTVGRQYWIVEFIRKELREVDDAYKLYRDIRDKRKTELNWYTFQGILSLIPGQKLLFFGVPIIFLAFWLMIAL